jgi:single-strand DNA-binding protein
MNYNKTILAGNMTRDPEIRVTPKGTSICQFSLAVNRTWKSESGEKQEEVSFIDCECWGKTAETVAKYFSKGKPIFVEGRLKQDTWEDKNTKEKRSKLKVVVEQFAFVGKPEGAQSQGTRPAADDKDDIQF